MQEMRLMAAWSLILVCFHNFLVGLNLFLMLLIKIMIGQALVFQDSLDKLHVYFSHSSLKLGIFLGHILANEAT